MSHCSLGANSGGFTVSCIQDMSEKKKNITVRLAFILPTIKGVQGGTHDPCLKGIIIALIDTVSIM